MNRESYEAKMVRCLLVVALAVAGGGCATVVVECQDEESEASESCVGNGSSEQNSAELPPAEAEDECLYEQPDNLCQQPNRNCWPQREKACAHGEIGYLCGYPVEPPAHCNVFFIETPSTGVPNPIWCCP